MRQPPWAVVQHSTPGDSYPYVERPLPSLHHPLPLSHENRADDIDNRRTQCQYPISPHDAQTLHRSTSSQIVSETSKSSPGSRDSDC